MKSILQITTPDEIGLLEKASDFIFSHGGSIDSDAVRVYGDWAILLLHFEADDGDLERMRSALAESYPSFSRMDHVRLIQTDEPNQPQPVPLRVWCRDVRGLLASITKLIQDFGYPILSHDGTRTLSGDYVSYEYMQTFTLSISPEQLDQPRWMKFKDQLLQMLEPLGGRFH